MLGRITNQLKDAAGALSGGGDKPLRKINVEKFAGGRGSTNAHARSEKRGSGRIRTNALKCELGEVTDLSASGVKIHSRKRPNVQVGETRSITLRAEEESVEVKAVCMWLRVDDNREFDIGMRIENADAAIRRRLMDVAATAQATDGLTRGWAPMF